MRTLKVVWMLVAIFVSLPISFYVQYQVLKRVNATELMWFLFWAAVPVNIFIGIVTQLINQKRD